MRPIFIAALDKRRPVVLLTREAVRPVLRHITVAPITSTIRGVSTEVVVGPANGIDAGSVISCDNIVTIPAESLIEQVGYLLPNQESSLAAAMIAAFDLDVPMPRN